MPTTTPWSAEALAGSTTVERRRGRNLSKADVLRVRVDGREIALKDYAARPFIARQTIGRLLVRRECRAYERAASSLGVAAFLGRVSAFALATAWVDATPLADLPRAPHEVFDRLDAILAGLHDRGLAIADLHHRDVLVGPEGSVHVVDLAAAYVLPASAGWWRRSVFARLVAQDRLAAARMRARFTGGSEEQALAGLDPRSVRLWGIGRRVKRVWDRLRGKRP